MTEQLSLFQLLDEWDTPLIPPERQKKGVKGWIIECSGIFLRKNGHNEDVYAVCTRPVVFVRDTEKKPDGRTWQYCETTRGPHHGWWGPCYDVFASRPTWNDCLTFAERNRLKEHPKKTVYYEVIGDWRGAKTEY